MRPRHKAAENRWIKGESALNQRRASMRPRHKAAENNQLAMTEHPFSTASMRPRHKAAENCQRNDNHDGPLSRFNEAAA